MNLAKREHIFEIVNRCKKGDKLAQYKIYMMYADAMFAICLRIIHNPKDAEEVVQDAFVKAFAKIGRLKDNKKFGGWLKKITINKCVDFVKKKKIIFDDLPANLSNTEDTDDMIFTIEKRTVMDAINELPEGCRLIINLYLLEDYKHKEISDMLKISESTSKSQYQRAKRLLKEKLMLTINKSS